MRYSLMDVFSLVPRWSREEEIRLAANGRASFEGNHPPVVRLYDTDSDAFWLLSAASPRNPFDFWGLAYLGSAAPEIGLIHFPHFARLADRIKVDPTFDAGGKPLSHFLAEARSSWEQKQKG